MGVLQSRFWDDRLIFTTGYREDTLTTNRATQGGEDFPGSINFLRLEPHTIFEKDREDVFKGDTTKFGGFFSVLPWLGLTFNTSDSIQPQTQTDIYGDPIGTRSGEGDDFGLRIKLLDDKAYFSATYWESADANQRISGTARIQWSPVHRAFNQVFDASVDAGVPLPPKLESRGLQQFDPTFWDVADFVGSGFEYELTGNITPQWSISLNYSSNDMEVGSNFAPGYHAFIVDNQSLYQGNQNVLLEDPIVNVRNFIIERDNSPDRDFSAEPATFNDVWEFGNQVVETIRNEIGLIPFNHNKDSLNFFTSYRFDDAQSAILKNLRIGFGGNYRSAPVIGFHSPEGGKPTPVEGESYVIARMMLGKRIPLKSGKYLDFQLNFDNVFGEEDLLPYGTNSRDTVQRYIFQRQRQEWTLRATFGF